MAAAAPTVPHDGTLQDATGELTADPPMMADFARIPVATEGVTSGQGVEGNDVDSGGGMEVGLEFTSGAELLVKGENKQRVKLPPSSSPEGWTVAALLVWINTNLAAAGKEGQLVTGLDSGGSVGGSSGMEARIGLRPGILLLVNDTDWELLGEGEYLLEPGDVVTFISTLHGG